MPALKPQTRFLLRGSALLIGLLSLWWFVLVNPMLYALEGAGGVFGLHIQETPSGDWTFRVPLEMTIPASPGQLAQQVHSIDFDMPRSDVIAFTFSLPVFWAVVLAIGDIRRSLRPLVIGTALMAGVELVFLFIFAQISARKTAAQLVAGSQGAGEAWLLHFGEYLTVSVLPYAVPFMVAFAVHPELRWQMFRMGTDPSKVLVSEVSGDSIRKRRRRR